MISKHPSKEGVESAYMPSTDGSGPLQDASRHNTSDDAGLIPYLDYTFAPLPHQPSLLGRSEIERIADSRLAASVPFLENLARSIVRQELGDSSCSLRSTGGVDAALIERKVVSVLSALPYVRSVSYAPNSEGDLFMVIRHDDDNVGEVIYELVGKLADLEQVPGIPYIDSRILRVCDRVPGISVGLKTIFER